MYEKYLMDIHYVNPILIVGLEGIVGFISLSIAFLPFKYSCPFDNLGVCKQLYNSLGSKMYSPLEDFPQKNKRDIYKRGFSFRVYVFTLWITIIQSISKSYNFLLYSYT